MTIDRHTLTTADVARVLEVSAERVRQLDSILRPVRRGRYRRFDPAVVQKLAIKRAR